ncbi:DEAD/DEAH box helicase [Pseudooceanicola sp. 200-1SW]|uniref:DEAD/DEAH box helicase n=1 Tax=Pseudooceanicola sp. 200-1SW TaxID=3425949 RepID=UPI003D8000EF
MISSLSEALTERGYDQLTPVQEAVSAPELAGSDLLVSAQTGSGKTVGFGLAIAPTLLDEAERFGPPALPLALIVAPTRELAFQVRSELQWLYAKTGAVVASCVGGMDMRQERRNLERGAHIVVGTPGRLRDHIERQSLDLSDMRAVVLDEADEMLDLGFRDDLEFILGEAPETRRTLLFSATVPPMIVKLAEQFQTDAQRISTLTGATQHADIAYEAVRVAQNDGEAAIFNLLRYHHDKGAIVFANTRAAVNHLTARLSNRGLATVSLSGELSQSERTHALQAMRDGRARVCVATDVAARGIDLPNLQLVIHADLPTNTESLLHRSGRTGRAGRKGISALIVPPKATKKAERLLKWAKITAEWTEAPSAEDIQAADETRLLEDPAWAEEVTEDQAAFAARLLERHGAEAIAAGYLRLYQSRHAAPEELRAPDAKPEKRPTQDFGPSRWFALSVGQADRAEARWLLPLLCRAGGLDKAQIGAIRVQDSETFVELAEPAVEGFLASLGEGNVLEEGVSARAVEGVPEFAPRQRSTGPRPGGGGKFGDKPRFDKPRGDGPRGDKPRGDKPRFDKPKGDRFGDKPRFDKPRGPRPDRGERDGAPRKPRFDREERDEAPRPNRFANPSERAGPPRDRKPRHKDGAKSDALRERTEGAVFGKPRAGGKPGAKFGGKPAGKPGGAKFGGKPGGKPAGKPGPKSEGRVWGKPAGGKPGGKPAGGKPKGKGFTGANDAPRRKG